MTAELIIYAVIAAGLVFWLRSILGTRNSEDRDSSNVINLELSTDGKILGLGGERSLDNQDKNIEMIEGLAKEAKGNMSIGSRTAELGLIDISKADKEFDIYMFLQAAQDAFVYVVESFAEGDRDTLKTLLSEEVYEAFDGAITAREEAGESVITEIHSINKSEVIEAKIDGKDAVVTVRFWADETSVTKDENSNIISGHSEKTTLMRDVWTFSRNVKSGDPRWFVIETREDGDSDNELVPNTQ